jgi:hypothetical protein
VAVVLALTMPTENSLVFITVVLLTFAAGLGWTLGGEWFAGCFIAVTRFFVLMVIGFWVVGTAVGEGLECVPGEACNTDETARVLWIMAGFIVAAAVVSAAAAALVTWKSGEAYEGVQADD